MPAVPRNVGMAPGSQIGAAYGAPIGGAPVKQLSPEDEIKRILMQGGPSAAALKNALTSGSSTFNNALNRRSTSGMGTLGRLMLGVAGGMEQMNAREGMDKLAGQEQQLKLAQYQQGRSDQAAGFERTKAAADLAHQRKIELMQKKAAAEGSNPSFGKTGTIGYDAQGNPFALQFSSSGQIRRTPIGSVPIYGGAPGGQPAGAAPQSVPMSSAPPLQQTADLGAGRFAPPVGSMTDASPTALTPQELADPNLSIDQVKPAGSPFTRPQDIMSVDTEDATVLYNKVTGQEIRRVPKKLGSKKAADLSVKRRSDLTEKAPKARAGIRSFISERQNVSRAIQDAVSIVRKNPIASGLLGTAMAQVPGTDAYNLAAALTTVGAGTAFGALKEMKASSPTGGALGQVTERELDLLQNSVSAIQQGQQPKTLVRNLLRVQKNFTDAENRLMKTYRDEFNPLGVGGPSSAGAAAQRVNSVEEARRLPKGTPFVTPTGEVKIR